jgi:release factor glutamine methyltransferase
MKTLGSVLQLSMQYLQDHKCAQPRRPVEELLGALLGLKRIELYMHFDRPLEEKELTAYRPWLARLAKGEPVEYILGEVEFYHCKIQLTPDVLIPRQETEILVDKICTRLSDTPHKQMWDVCCGSGCLGISLKKALPQLDVFLSDISSQALAVAKKNAEENGVEIQLLQGDLLEPFKGMKADFLICNPPYVSEGEYAVLDPSVRDFEPRTALVGGQTGLEFYERLARELPSYLNPGAKLFFELGTGQGEAIKGLFSAPCWKGAEIEKDWAGHDRFFFLEFE